MRRGIRRDRRRPSRSGGPASRAGPVEAPRRPCDNRAPHVCPPSASPSSSPSTTRRHRPHAARAGARGADAEGDHRRRRLLDRRHRAVLEALSRRDRRTRPRTGWSSSSTSGTRGKGAAMRTAVGHMTGDIALIQDADLEYDPREYPRLIQPILDGHADVVYGSRFSGSPRRVLLFWHTVGNRFLTLLSNMCTNLNLTDMETCYKVFRADILRRHPDPLEPLRPRARADRQDRRASAAASTRCRSRTTGGSTPRARRSAGRTASPRSGRSSLHLRARRRARGRRATRRSAASRRCAATTRSSGSMMQPFVGQRVLEVGAGTGVDHPLPLDARAGRRPPTSTPSTSSCSAARSPSTPNVEVRALDLARPGADDGVARGAFDTVVCSNVLEHVEDDDAALARDARGARAGRSRVLIVPALPGALRQHRPRHPPPPPLLARRAHRQARRRRASRSSIAATSTCSACRAGS